VTRKPAPPFTISGTTNLAPNNQLLIEITPASFVPGTVTVIAGNPNTWSHPVSGHSLPIDPYTIRVSGIAVYTATPSSFSIIASSPVQPDKPRTDCHNSRANLVTNRTPADPALILAATAAGAYTMLQKH
jgi:hypothetical protein